MKKFFKPQIIVMVILMINSCKHADYLPHPKELQTSLKGSYIEVATDNKETKGELIAVDDSTLVVLENRYGDPWVVIIQQVDVNWYKIWYAKVDHYGWSMPASALLTASHGYFAALSMPINLLVTGVVTSSAYNDFSFKDDELTFDELRMYARFPQGLPPKLDLRELK